MPRLSIPETANPLFLCYTLVAHLLPRLGDLSQDILSRQIARAEHSSADGKVGAVAPKPVAGRIEHDGSYEQDIE
jgi:hypothetical protein